MENIYTDGEYAENNPSWHEEDSPFKARHINQLIQKNSLSHPKALRRLGAGSA